MTIAMIGHKGIPAKSGGVERVVHELASSLASRGHRVISYDRKQYIGSDGPVSGVIRRMSFGIATKHLDAITHTLSAIVIAMREKPDIIHIHGVGPALAAPVARLLHPKARIIVTFHCVDRAHAKWGGFAKAMLRLGELFACVFAHRTITVSDAVASYCLEEYQCQTRVIPNGVRVRSALTTDALAAYGLRPTGYLLMVTRLVGHKNVHVAIEAYRRLRERRPDLVSDIPLVIAGASAETDAYADELHRRAELVPGVHFVGEKHGVELLELQSHAAAHLSIASSEGMSLSLLEAMGAGRPVIVSDLPENTVVTGTDALIVKTNDAEDLADAIIRLLSMDRADRERMARLLRERAVRNHDWNAIAEATECVYREALESRRLRLNERLI
jgi:glycosyltransferase involved in cell wall biosynthesis